MFWIALQHTSCNDKISLVQGLSKWIPGTFWLPLGVCNSDRIQMEPIWFHLYAVRVKWRPWNWEPLALSKGEMDECPKRGNPSADNMEGCGPGASLLKGSSNFHSRVLLKLASRPVPCLNTLRPSCPLRPSTLQYYFIDPCPLSHLRSLFPLHR